MEPSSSFQAPTTLLLIKILAYWQPPREKFYVGNVTIVHIIFQTVTVLNLILSNKYLGDGYMKNHV
jgi:hypothetical protein